MHLEVQSHNNGILVTPVDKPDAEPVPLEVFRTQQIDALIRSPLKLTLGRLSGLKRILEIVESQISDIPVAPEAPLSSGN